MSEKENKKEEGLPMKGKIKVELKDEEGNVKETIEKDNTFMDSGDAHVADQLAATPGESTMGWMAVGTSGTALGAAATTLGNELDRNALDSGYPEQGTGANDNDVIYKGSWAAGDGSGALTEAGIFNSSSGGSMLAGSTFSVINKGANDSLTITWTITAGG